MIGQFLALTVGCVIVFGGGFACVARFAILGKCKAKVSSRMNERRFNEALDIEHVMEEKMDEKRPVNYRQKAVPSVGHI